MSLSGKMPGNLAKSRIIERLKKAGATLSNKRFYSLMELAVTGRSVLHYYGKLIEDGTVYGAFARTSGRNGRRFYISYNDIGLPPQNTDCPIPEINRDGNILQNSRLPFLLGP